MLPRISVGMPVYNSAQFLRPAIESVLSQSHRDLELVISDNASTDGSIAICEEYARADARVRVLRNEVNGGAAVNFNRTFHHARGRYFMWASSNDCVAPDFVRDAAHVLDERDDVVVCCGQTRYFIDDPANSEAVDDPMNFEMASPVERFTALLQRLRINNVMHGLIRSAELRRTALIGNYFSSDNVLVAELSLRGRFVQLPSGMLYRRMSEDAATLTMSDEELARIYARRPSSIVRFRGWRVQRGYWALLARVQLPAGERLALARELLKRVYWDRGELLRELRDALPARRRVVARPRTLE